MKKIFKNIDKPLLIISIILFAIGLIMIFSSSNIMAFMSQGTSPYRYFVKQAIFLFGSFCLALIFIRFTTKSYGTLSSMGIIGVIALLVYLLATGVVKNQAVSWFDLGFFSVQPSEFAKIIIIMWMASYYDRVKDKLDKYGPSLLPLGVTIIIAVLIFIQPDLGTTVIFLAIAFFVFISAPIIKEIKVKTIFLAIGGLVVTILVLVASGKEFLLSRQLDRFNLANPCSTEKFYTTGNQLCNGYIAINNGKAFGVGLGNSTQKYLYLPEAHTDFIFAIVMEELGLIAAVGIIILYFLLLGRIVKIGRESYTNRGAMMCYGIAVYIGLHIIINICGLFGLIPLTGVPLPFISYGGSFTLCLVVALTIVQRVNMETRLQLEVNNKKEHKKISK
ncbi:MAG: FtsW/RodA/SpoVE family cell cycle protein [Bacilli bacterium]